MHPYLLKAGSLQDSLHPPEIPPSHVQGHVFIAAVPLKNAFFHLQQSTYSRAERSCTIVLSFLFHSDYGQNVEKPSFTSSMLRLRQKGSGAQ